MNKANINIGDCKIKILITQPLCICFYIALMKDLRSGRCPRDIVYIYIFKLTKGFPYLYYINLMIRNPNSIFSLVSALFTMHCILYSTPKVLQSVLFCMQMLASAWSTGSWKYIVNDMKMKLCKIKEDMCTMLSVFFITSPIFPAYDNRNFIVTLPNHRHLDYTYYNTSLTFFIHLLPRG